jgi:hypothetical protein
MHLVIMVIRVINFFIQLLVIYLHFE